METQPSRDSIYKFLVNLRAGYTLDPMIIIANLLGILEGMGFYRVSSFMPKFRSDVSLLTLRILSKHHAHIILFKKLSAFMLLLLEVTRITPVSILSDKLVKLISYEESQQCKRHITFLLHLLTDIYSIWPHYYDDTAHYLFGPNLNIYEYKYLSAYAVLDAVQSGNEGCLSLICDDSI